MPRIIIIIIALAVFVAAPMVLAEDAADIRHPAARKAVARAEQETRKAEQVYQQAMIRIQRELIRELESAKSDAMQRQLLDEANRIQQAIDSAKVELALLTGDAVGESFRIAANSPWTQTVSVRKGQTVTVTASGQWNGAAFLGRQATCGPDGMKHPKEGHHAYYLQGRVSGDEPVFIGSQKHFVATRDGVLEFGMRDDVHDNNAGSLTVRIIVSD